MIILNLIRAVFLTLVTAVAVAYLSKTVADAATYAIMSLGVVTAFAVLTLDFIVKKKNLSAISGLFLGILVGLLVSMGFGLILDRVLGIFLQPEIAAQNYHLIEGSKLLLGLTCCYLSVSLILQTKDDVRFIIPYVEFARETKGPRPVVLDTSALIDGRVVDLTGAGLLVGRILVPQFVVQELQVLADSHDKLKRARGRRGLDMLQKLQALPGSEVILWDGSLPGLGNSDSVDPKLLALSLRERGRLVTTDLGLHKVAQVQGVDVINLNNIAQAMRPHVLPGEQMKVKVIKIGEGPTQGIGYFDDGTMVVVEGGRDRIGMEVDLVVTSALQTSAGRMIFGRVV